MCARAHAFCDFVHDYIKPTRGSHAKALECRLPLRHQQRTNRHQFTLAMLLPNLLQTERELRWVCWTRQLMLLRNTRANTQSSQSAESADFDCLLEESCAVNFTCDWKQFIFDTKKCDMKRMNKRQHDNTNHNEPASSPASVLCFLLASSPFSSEDRLLLSTCSPGYAK